MIVATIKPDMEEVEAELGKEAAQDPKKVEALLWSMVDKRSTQEPAAVRKDPPDQRSQGRL